MNNTPARLRWYHVFRKLHVKLDAIIAGVSLNRSLIYDALDQGKDIMTLAQDQVAAQAKFQADFNQFKIDFAALVADLRNAINTDDEAALQASLAGLQTMDSDLQGMDTTAVNAVKPTVPPSTGPAAPTGVNAVAGSGQVVLSWSNDSSTTGNNVYWASSPGVTIANGTKIAGATSPLTDLKPAGAPVFYVVTATNANGESPVSAEVTATPTA